MKKILAAILSVFFVAVSFAQVTLTKVIHLDGEPTPFIKVTQQYLVDNFGTDEIDTIRTYKLGNDYYVRKVGDAGWNIKDLHISKNNTAARNSYWLNKALSMSYIDEIIVNDNKPGTFYFSAGFNAKGRKFTYKAGQQIDGTTSITVDSITVQASYNQRLFGDNIALTNPKSSDRFFSVEWVGLIGGGSVTNTKAMVRKFQNLHNIHLLFYNRDGYAIDTTMLIHRDNNIETGLSQLIIANTWRGTGLQIGDSLLTYRPYGGDWNIKVMNSVFAPTFTTADSNHIGVRIINAEEVKNVNITYVNGFYNAFVLEGSNNNGCVGNMINVPKTNNSINHIVLRNRTGGWCNGNTINVGHVRNQSGFNLTLRTTAITVGDPNHQWVCQGNKFFGGTYELNNTTLGRLCYIRFGMSNTLTLDYMEANGNIAMYVGTNTQNAYNEVRLGHTSSPAHELVSDSSVLSGNTLRSNKSRALTENLMPIYDIKDFSKCVVPMNAQGSLAVGGGLNAVLMSIHGGVIDSLGDAYFKDGFLVMKAGTYYALGTGLISTENVKEFVVRTSTQNGYDGKLYFKQYDTLGAIIDNTNTIDKIRATNTSYWNAGYFGGTWEVGTLPGNYSGDIRVSVANRCKYVQVFLKAGMSGNDLRAKGIYIGAADFGHATVTTNIGMDARVRQKPTVGDFEAGQEFVDINGNNKRMWRVVKSGTLRANPLVANLTTVNNNRFVTPSVSLDSFQLGQFLQFGNNNVQRIVRKTATQLVMDNVVWQTGTAAAVFPAPQFIEITEGSAGMINPMTTAGDIVIGGTSGAPARLAKGSNGQSLKVLSGNVAWVTDFENGRYTPTVSAVSNIASSSANSFFYKRDGNIVTAKGTITVATNTASPGSFTLSLPISSTITNTDQQGTIICKDELFSNVSLASSNNIYFSITPSNTTTKIYLVEFMYVVQ